MNEIVTLGMIKERYAQLPNVIMRHLEFFRDYTVFARHLKPTAEQFQKQIQSMWNIRVIGYSLNEHCMLYVGAKKDIDVYFDTAEIEYLWVKYTNNPIYYEVYLEDIRLLRYIHPPVVNIGETCYRIKHPSGETIRSADFIHALTEIQSHLVPNFYHYKIQDIRTFTKIRRRKDKLYFNIQPVITLKYEDIPRRDILSLFETFGKLAKFYKKYNKE